MEKLVPKLRFPEFKGNWERKKIGDIFKVNAGGDVPKKNVSFTKSEKFKYPIYANATENKGLYGYSDIYKIEPNVLTIAGRGVNIGVAHARNHEFYPIVRLLVLKPKKNEDIYFFEYQINNLNLFVESTGVPQLTAPQISGYLISFPQPEEQQKIASFLTSVDERLTLLAQQKEKLELYKKGVMQQIFAQKLRFKDENGNNYPDWEEKKLGEITKITTGSSNRQDSGLNGEFTFFDRSEDIRTSNIFLFDAEAIIVAGEGSDFIPKYFIGKFDLHQRTYAIMNFKKSEGKFLFYYIYFFRNYFLSQAVGSTVKSLRLPMFQKMSINLPCIEEQQKIASFLSAIDVQIEGVSNKIEQTKTFKKGLLQQMFV